MNEKLQALIAEYEKELDFYKARMERLLKAHDELGYIHASAKASLLENVIDDLKALQ